MASSVRSLAPRSTVWLACDGDAADQACGGRADVAGIADGIGLGMAAFDDAEGAVADVDFARLAVQFEEQGAGAVGMGVAAW